MLLELEQLGGCRHSRRASPVKAGWLVKNKGQWSLTDDGRAAYC
jgi:hypothetical protein